MVETGARLRGEGGNFLFLLSGILVVVFDGES